MRLGYNEFITGVFIKQIFNKFQFMLPNVHYGQIDEEIRKQLVTRLCNVDTSTKGAVDQGKRTQEDIKNAIVKVLTI